MHALQERKSRRGNKMVSFEIFASKDTNLGPKEDTRYLEKVAKNIFTY